MGRPSHSRSLNVWTNGRLVGDWRIPARGPAEFRLPLGLVGNRQADMRTSVENEWLCAQLLRGFGLPVAACEIHRFGAQKALVVERFDRRRAASGEYWLRLPQRR